MWGRERAFGSWEWMMWCDVMTTPDIPCPLRIRFAYESSAFIQNIYIRSLMLLLLLLLSNDDMCKYPMGARRFSSACSVFPQHTHTHTLKGYQTVSINANALIKMQIDWRVSQTPHWHTTKTHPINSGPTHQTFLFWYAHCVQCLRRYNGPKDAYVRTTHLGAWTHSTNYLLCRLCFCVQHNVKCVRSYLSLSLSLRQWCQNKHQAAMQQHPHKNPNRDKNQNMTICMRVRVVHV